MILTLEKIERQAGFVAHLPPCSEDNYNTLAEHYKALQTGYRHSLENCNTYLDLLSHACTKTGDTGRFEDAKNTYDYNRRIIDILSSDAEIREDWQNRTKVKTNGRRL